MALHFEPDIKLHVLTQALKTVGYDIKSRGGALLAVQGSEPLLSQNLTDDELVRIAEDYFSIPIIVELAKRLERARDDIELRDAESRIETLEEEALEYERRIARLLDTIEDLEAQLNEKE